MAQVCARGSGRLDAAGSVRLDAAGSVGSRFDRVVYVSSELVADRLSASSIGCRFYGACGRERERHDGVVGVGFVLESDSRGSVERRITRVADTVRNEAEPRVRRRP